MTALKQFVSTEVTNAQAQLHEILLINLEEDREAVAPTFNLRMLNDNPSIDSPGWSFYSRMLALKNWTNGLGSALWRFWIVNSLQFFRHALPNPSTLFTLLTSKQTGLARPEAPDMHYLCPIWHVLHHFPSQWLANTPPSRRERSRSLVATVL